MASVAGILQQMRDQPHGVRFTDASKVVTHYFGEPRQDGTSHKVWKMPWAGDPRVNLQRGKSGKAKTYQVRQAVQAIDTLMAERAEGHGESQANETAATVEVSKDKPKKPATKKSKKAKPKTQKRRS